MIRWNQLQIYCLLDRKNSFYNEKLEEANRQNKAIKNRLNQSGQLSILDNLHITGLSPSHKRVWLLHCLAFSYEPQASIFQVGKGCRFSDVHFNCVRKLIYCWSYNRKIGYCTTFLYYAGDSGGCMCCYFLYSLKLNSSMLYFKIIYERDQFEFFVCNNLQKQMHCLYWLVLIKLVMIENNVCLSVLSHLGR